MMIRSYKNLNCSFAFLVYSNHKFAEFYTDLNDIFKRLEDKMYIIHKDAYIPLSRLREVETNAKCLDIFTKKASRGSGVFETLQKMVDYNLYPIGGGIEPTIPEGIKILEKLIEKLKTGTNGQTFAFKSERALDVYYYSGIVLPREFKFIGEGSDAKGVITYDQYMPFHNDHHVDENCVSVKNLPWFFKHQRSPYGQEYYCRNF